MNLYTVNMTACVSPPEYPQAEEVDLRVFTAEGLLIASTPFIYYELPHHNSDMMLHILSQQLHNYFPVGQGAGGGVVGSSGQVRMLLMSICRVMCLPPQGGGGGSAYGGGFQVPGAAYQLLLGACRLGCEPLVSCLLSLPAMSVIGLEELQKACDIAAEHGHRELSSVLMQMVTMHSIHCEPSLMSRGEGREKKADADQPHHVEEYYVAMGKLSKGGSTPTGR